MKNLPREEPVLTLRPRPRLDRLAAELRAVRSELVAHSHSKVLRGTLRPNLAPSWAALADRYGQLLLTAGEMLGVAPPPPPDSYWELPAIERDHARWRLPSTEWSGFEDRLADAGLHVAEP